MLRGYITNITTEGIKSKDRFLVFPNKESQFNEYFVNYKTNKIINKNIFQERITGLVSYYAGYPDPNHNVFPKVKMMPISQIHMSIYQWRQYANVRMQEIREEKLNKFRVGKFVELENKKPARESSSTYRIKSRYISNFALPEYAERPRFKPGERRQDRILILDDLLKKIRPEDLLPAALNDKYSPKFDAMLANINKTKKGLIIIYSEFISLEGLGIFGKVLRANGYNEFPVASKYKSFAIWSGRTSDTDRDRIFKTFISSENKYGELIRILLVTSVATEGISLRNVREIHIIEPYWHLSRIKQIIGRTRRPFSHEDLPLQERLVSVYVYLSIAPKNISPEKDLGDFDDTTTDQHIFLRATKENIMIEQFHQAMKETAIDCSLNLDDNKAMGELKSCIRCKPQPADILEDEKMYTPNLRRQLIMGQSYCY